MDDGLAARGIEGGGKKSFMSAKNEKKKAPLDSKGPRRPPRTLGAFCTTIKNPRSERGEASERAPGHASDDAHAVLAAVGIVDEPIDERRGRHVGRT